MRPLITVAVGCLIVGALTGCGSDKDASDNNTQALATSSAAPTTAAVIAAFDPCNGLPASFLDAERLSNKEPWQNTSGDLHWEGCFYQQKRDGYAVSIENTNMTLDILEKRHQNPFRRFQIAGRNVATDGPSSLSGGTDCTLLIEQKNGSLDIEYKNPPKVRNHADPCAAAIGFAEKIIPFLPGEKP